MSCAVRRSAIGAALLWLALPARAGEVLETAALRVSFGEAAEGFSIVSVENKLVGNVRFVSPTASDATNFWALSFSDGGGRRVELTNRSPAQVRCAERMSGGVRFVWKGLTLPEEEAGNLDVTATVALAEGEDATEWRIKVDNRSTRWALEETVYPCLRQVVRPGEADVLLPHMGLGARLLKKFDGHSRNLACAWGEYEYPSYFPMMTAFMIGEAGLYVAAEDPEARMKTFWINDLNVEFRTPVENAGVVGKAADGPGYAVKVQAFRGDWWRAARIYRAWALRQRWAAKGPLADRSDYPAAMREPAFWYCRYQYDVKRFRTFFEKFRAEAPDVPVGIRWYKWHSGDMDTNFPEFLPALDGVGETGEALCKIGFTAMPYINARIWDTKCMSYRYARKDVCRRANGDDFLETWNGKPYGRHDFGIMCPAASDWQDLLHRLATETIAQTKCNAVYYDQVGCARPCPCRNPSHGHPVGGGRWWTDAYRRILARAHDEFAPKGVAMTTEGTAECYMDVCDGFLATSVPSPEDVPFYPAVYSGYTIYFSSRFSPRQPFALAYPLMAREFTWGFANGWSDDWRGTKGIEDRVFDAALGFARARVALKEFLVTGFLRGEARPVESPDEVPYVAWESLHSRKNQVEGRLSAVIGTWWTDRTSAKRALVGVNVSERPQTVRFRMPSGAFAPVDLPHQAKPACSPADGRTTALTVAPHTIFCLVGQRKE